MTNTPIPNHDASDELMTAVTGRRRSAFAEAFDAVRTDLVEVAASGPILVVGAAGSIGAAVVRTLHEADCASLVVLDSNENGLTELVRDLHATGLARRDVAVRPVLADITSRWLPWLHYEVGAFHTIMNLAAVKHVRSERDVMSLLRMYEVNVAGTLSLLELLRATDPEGRFFSVSSDKAANPTSLMGASKRLMELSMAASAPDIRVSSCRFANVAFSAGSLLESWLQRMSRKQPISVPTGIRRYFITPREASELCIVTTCLGDRSIMIPDFGVEENLRPLDEVLVDVLSVTGATPEYFEDEAAAIASARKLSIEGRQAVVLTPGDTTGEKPFEEFLGDGEDSSRMDFPGVLTTPLPSGVRRPEHVMSMLDDSQRVRLPSMVEFIDAVLRDVPTFTSAHSARSLDDRL